MLFQFPVAAANDIFQYLATRPYAEVAVLIDGMKSGKVIEAPVVEDGEAEEVKVDEAAEAAELVGTA